MKGDAMGTIQGAFHKYVSGEKGKKIILIAGIAGMVLILLSSFWPKSETATKNEETTTTMTTSEYTDLLQQRLASIVNSIEGVGQSEIMVTLETGVQNIYANQEQKNTDKSQDITGENTTRIQERQDVEQNVILVDDPEGGEKALIKTQLEPQIKGVVVVCQGGDDPVVQTRISQAITTALDISSKRVCVTKRSSETK
ncbi:hypothetical protein [Solibaculum mannosilyticum]|uniref:Stage III sporulation protein AG n=1 Tax=Solibaculum mannosilyticum TaxID=2780922 RepID=A0A7I8D4U7_9FIRM|nr:hypothetical protein [Solibaculum mannosilyticum]MCO7136758.1 stage III sporulation protein AG [[Clostridium] leptum]BCI60509.1 hypothetical protein C12CBH8_11480 [Solibaculum mannosilyticum]CZT57064.1 hypothetical protein BN3661_01776 [Eubacteriaceae bacterium CHKCI005]